jgi:hypothetical protein
MRSLIFFIMAVFMMTAYAQKSPVEKFIKKQSKSSGFAVQEIDVSSEEFTANFQIGGDDAEEILSQIEVIRILSSDSTATAASKADFLKKAHAALGNDSYTELAVVKSDGDDVGLYANMMDNGLIREMVVLIGGGESAMMVYMKGELDMSNAFSSDLFGSMMGGKKGKDRD